MDYPAGEAITVEVITPQVPVGPVTAILKDATGTVLSNSLTTGSVGNLVSISLPSSYTSLSGPGAEPRFLTVSYTSGGRTYRQSTALRLVPFMATLVEPESVLSFIGLSGDEAPDINIYNAYRKAEEAIGTFSYSEQTDRLILLYAAYDALFMVEMKARQREKSGDAEIDRYKGIDFEALRARIAGEISDLVAEITGTEDEAPALLVLGSPTDPVTNE